MLGEYPMQNLCLAVIILMPLLSLLVCSLRFYAKRRSPGEIGLDDWLIALAVLCSFIIIYPSWRLTVMWNWGIHIWEVNWRYREPNFWEDHRLQTTFYTVSSLILPLVKASILVLLLKVGGIIVPIKRAAYVLLAVTTIGAAITFFYYLFQCPPLTGGTWRPTTFGGLHCAGRTMIGRINIFQVCFNMLTDVLIFPIPVYLTWKLQKTCIRDRIIVILLFSLSLCVTAIGAWRVHLTYQGRLYSRIKVDWTWSIAFCVNHLEHGLAIIFACVPSLRILILGWLGYRDRENKSISYDRSHSNSRSKTRSRAFTDSQANGVAYPVSIVRRSTQSKGIEVTCLTTFDVESSIIPDYPTSGNHSQDDASSYYGSRPDVDLEAPPPAMTKY